MVFARLAPSDKDAFFALLDELSTTARCRPDAFAASYQSANASGRGGSDALTAPRT